MSGSQNTGSTFGLSSGGDASIFGTNQLPDVLGLVRERLQQAASNPDLLSQVFGDKANTSELQSVIKQWAIGDFSQLPSVQILSADITKGAFGLYAHDTQTVYLSDTLFQSNAAPTNSLFGAVGVLVEETFHWLDDRVGDDTAGDEGELARNLVFGANLSSNELARIRSENDSGIIVLNGQSLSVEQNDTLSTADNLGTLNSVCLIKNGWVGSYWDGSRMKAVPNDYYRFYVNNTTQLDLTLYNLGSDVDLYLLNSNGSTITSSRRSGTSNENISSRLDAGSYYIQVRQYGGNSNYSLGINSIVAPYDYAGNSTGSARYIGTLGTSNSNYGGDWLGWADNNDYYRFSLNGTRDLRLSLTGLSADADVQVLNSFGTVIGSSALNGNNSESINLNNLGAGTYYARVYQYSGDTYYNLNLRAENRIDQYMATVRQIYLDVLNREPDSGGQQGWANAMLSGSTYAQVRSGIANSQESRNNVNNAYLNVLMRNADAGGLQGYVNALANNSTLRQVYESIATSTEARSNFWTAQYYNNTDRNGSVVFAQSFGRTNTGFDRNWGNGSPSGWVSSDNFSARIFGQVTFGAGLQEIRVGADDGVRVRVGGQLVIDRLVDQPFTTSTAVFNAGNGGNFNVEIEYYERSGTAALSFGTRFIAPPDSAGNSRDTARYIGNLGINYQGVTSFSSLYSDWVGSTDNNDYYRFDLGSQTNFSLTLTGLSADADVRLLNSSGGEIDHSTLGGVRSESINRQLGAGTYYAWVYSYNGANTNYALNFSGVSLSNRVLSSSYNVNLWLYDTNGRNTKSYINSDRDTVVVIHGWNNNDQTEGINKLAKEAAKSGQQVVALDWGSIAQAGLDLVVPTNTAGWITPVAQSVSTLLGQLKISSSRLTLIGHSLGTYVASEIGRIRGQVRSLVALDPANNTDDSQGLYDLDRNTSGMQRSVRFDSVAQYSLSFVVGDLDHGLAGNNNQAGTANDSFVIDDWGQYWSATPSDIWAHGAVVDLFRNALDRNLLNLNNLSLSRPSLVRNWYDNNGDVDNISDRYSNRGLHEGSIQARYIDGNWRINGLRKVVAVTRDWFGNEYGTEETIWT